MGPGLARHAAYKPKGLRGPTEQMCRTDGVERDSEAERPARAFCPALTERDTDANVLGLISGSVWM